MAENNEKTTKNILEDVKDDSKSFTKKEIEDGKAMAILSYLGILVLIPYFAEKNNKYVVYHAKQGLNLLIIEAILAVATGILNAILVWFLWWLLGIVNFAVSAFAIALSIIGIVNACQGKAKELPIVNKIKIIK